MSRQNRFDGLPEFLAIARQRSIRGAALALDVTPGAVSQALQRLERRLGVALFHRTTRRLSLTGPGEALLARIGPAADAIDIGLEEALRASEEPVGTLRLIVDRIALTQVLPNVLPDFRQAYPAVAIDITVSNRQSDFVGEGYDAGIMIGSYIAQEMIAVRLSPRFRWAVFGSPAYFAAHGRPERPGDLASHQCIRFRRPGKGDIYRWEFVEDGEVVRIEPNGPMTVNDAELMRRMAARGLGLIYSSTYHSATEIEAGTLEPVLLDHSPSADALYLYFARTAQDQPKLRAFIEMCARSGFAAARVAPGAGGAERTPQAPGPARSAR
ncbi:LysR family transcriptional regulator [Enterovirga rhinocerotis]|uniref:DNA-binding transcriptional LysR family regulator n=1 Tax=Enterovirga rhinocerotis TaxID=1339210 RepID=A0A4R7C9L7_9HYPH|nr:LysR family transcriptional regulator [Enterovirga rhinocerotis]TDR94742.1 DNA-binding transcriptional LysR family regulator [Enterovirga rhinocerotis]